MLRDEPTGLWHAIIDLTFLPSDAEPIAQAIPPGAQRGNRDTKCPAARERKIFQRRPNIEPLRMSGNRLAQYFSEQMRRGHAMTAIAMRKIYVVGQLADVRDARKRQREVAAPRIVDSARS